MTSFEAPGDAARDRPAYGDGLAAAVGRLSAVLASEHYPAGDRAALKRHAPGQPPPLAFYRLWLRHLHDELPPEPATQAWALLAWGLAFSGRQAHRPDRPLGRALAESAFAEARLERLLAAPDGEVRHSLAEAAVRFLGAKGEAFDWAQLAQLLLTRDDQARERLHRRIATDYYRHLPRTDKE